MNSPRPMIPPPEVEHFRLRARADFYTRLTSALVFSAIVDAGLGFFFPLFWLWGGCALLASLVCGWRVRAIYRRLQELEVFIP